MKAVAAVLLLSTGLLVLACRSEPQPPAAKPVLRVATAFAPFSTRLTEEYRRTLPDLDIQEMRALSSNEVLRLIQRGDLDFGVALADDAYRSYFGTAAAAADTPRDSRVRGISLLQPLPMYLLVRAGSGVHSVSDLKGRVVAVGPENSSSWTLANLVLKAFKVDPVTVKPLSSRDEAAQGLRSGTFDAIVLPGYVYPDEVTQSVIRSGAYLCRLTGHR